MLSLYRFITVLSAPLLSLLIKQRVKLGKEDQKRIDERQGISTISRPKGKLVWIHAASVGESLSALILIDKMAALEPQTHFLVTTGTVTSAGLMAKRLPTQAIHQYYPFDRPQWVSRFLDHWQPDLALWMESELWPNMLLALENRKIPAALINARLSDRSYNRWKLFRQPISTILSTFNIILAQTETDGLRYKALSNSHVLVTDNLKYSAAPLPYNEDDLAALQKAIGQRPSWVYASSHAGEETLSCRLHLRLKKDFPDLLTIIVPRHPDRRDEILTSCDNGGLSIIMRGVEKQLPAPATDIYIADTMGELGLFYRLAPIALIGRSFSHDGGGGHNPIEAAQLDCAVLTGPNVQNQKQLFDEMISGHAAKQVQSEDELYDILYTLFSKPESQASMIKTARDFARTKENIVNVVMKNLKPLLQVEKKEAA